MSITRVYSDGNTVSGSDMNTIVSGINTNETSINGLTTAKVDKVSGKSLVLDTEIAKIHTHTNEIILDNTTASYTTTDKSKLDGITANSTKVASSSTNGNIKINDVENPVYVHPTGTTTTNPHGTTKTDVGLSDVDNTSDIAKNVLSATKLTTPRNINGIVFDGSADITLPTASINSDLSMNNFKITNVGEPINGQDVVTKNYADSLRSGLSVKDPVRVATTVNLTGTYNTLVFTSTDLGAIVIDGITLILNDRVLVKNQTIATQNGIYYVSQVGDVSTPYKLTRTSDSNTSIKVVTGMSTWIDEGTVNSDCRWVLNTNSIITLDTTGLVFSKDFQASDLVANGGITKSGNTISLTTGIATVGTYKSVTVDTSGRVTSGTNPTTITGYGITDFASNVLSTVLIGLSTATNSVISVTDTVLSSLGKLQKQISDHLIDVVKHITSDERTSWNSKTKTEVSLTNGNIKIDSVEIKIYDDTTITNNINTHKNDSVSHITSAERITWNGKATQTDINNSINAIQIGGRNYIQKNKLASYNPYNTTPIWTESTKTISTTMTSIDTTMFTLMVSEYIPTKGTYILSGIFKRNGIPVTNSIWANRLANVSGTLIHFYLDDTTGYFEITQTRDGVDNWIINTYIPTGTVIGDVLSFTNLKFEKGNKATDWTPAIEDTQMLITNGTTATRPTATYIGQSHFDTTLGKPIWWNGTVWKDAIGTTV